MSDQPIDVRVWQKVGENPVFCNVSWSVGIQVTDIPKYFEIKNILMFVLLLGCVFCLHLRRLKSKLLCWVSLGTHVARCWRPINFHELFRQMLLFHSSFQSPREQIFKSWLYILVGPACQTCGRRTKDQIQNYAIDISLCAKPHTNFLYNKSGQSFQIHVCVCV